MMPHSAYRYRAHGTVLGNTIFASPNSEFLGAFHGVPTDEVYHPELAAIESAQQILSHKQDFAAAFGIPADQIEVEWLTWDGIVPDGMNAAQRVAQLYPDPPDALAPLAVVLTADQVGAAAAVAYEAQVVVELRALAEERLAARGVGKPAALDVP